MDETENSVEPDGLIATWEPDKNHGPWQATAPGWAVREFARVKDLVRAGKWWPPHPVGDMGEGHVVHLVAMWDQGELVDGPQRDVYYEATVKWSDGTVAPLLLWNDTGHSR